MVAKTILNYWFISIELNIIPMLGIDVE